MQSVLLFYVFTVKLAHSVQISGALRSTLEQVQHLPSKKEGEKICGEINA